MTEIEYFIENTLKNSDMLSVDWFIEKHNLKCDGRKSEVVVMRQYLMYKLRMKTLLTCKEVGEKFDRKHCTVISNYDRVRNWIKHNDKRLLSYIELHRDDLDKINYSL